MSKEFDNVDLSSPPVKKEQEEKEPKKEKEKTLGDVLSVFAGAPDSQQLEKWKQVHGEVLCSSLSDTELFVFRPITRGEFVNLQAHLKQVGDEVDNFSVETKVVETCLLWASNQAVQALEKKAGTYSTLQEQILQASNFMNPAYVSQFVVKL